MRFSWAGWTNAKLEPIDHGVPVTSTACLAEISSVQILESESSKHDSFSNNPFIIVELADVAVILQNVV